MLDLRMSPSGENFKQMEKVQSRELPQQLLPISQENGGGGGGGGGWRGRRGGGFWHGWQLGWQVSTCENASACQCILDSPKRDVGVKIGQPFGMSLA